MGAVNSAYWNGKIRDCRRNPKSLEEIEGKNFW